MRVKNNMLEAKELQKVQRSFTDMKDRLAFVFEALGDPTRLNIFKLLSKEKKAVIRSFS